jgi:hypothetical protein
VEEYSIIVEAALNYLNNADEEEYLSELNKWAAALSLPPLDSISLVLSMFEKTIGIDFVRVPGWQRFSEFAQLKGIHFCQNFISIQESAFGLEPIVIKDDRSLLSRLLSNFGEKNPSLNVYANYKLMAHIKNSREQPIPKDAPKKSVKEEVFSTVER